MKLNLIRVARCGCIVFFLSTHYVWLALMLLLNLLKIIFLQKRLIRSKRTVYILRWLKAPWQANMVKLRIFFNQNWIFRQRAQNKDQPGSYCQKGTLRAALLLRYHTCNGFQFCWPSASQVRKFIEQVLRFWSFLFKRKI